ncbi:zinc metalloproteinase-disintegrin-like brevilysin H2a [Cyprinodon tularosa]|uniref:zinc metalloproteinase-disintegrin-like brevilysin H2a n=1 Tax=Cyprinodon tularosa TaxID=77115 RepID=UPI0018E28B93|nr:zinc metalloproteinase-disintegrin-like brevilysin H2a [Cyprinodon tularosa]
MTRTLLLWLLFLNVSFKPSESHSPGFEVGDDYEVVRPVRLHAVRKRSTENLRPQTVKYAMTVGGKNIQLQLEKNTELLGRDYTETSYQEDGTRVTSRPHDVDHCYYQGTIANDRESSASISTCDGLRGYFRTSAQRYLIEPLSGGDEGDHAVTAVNETSSKPALCGVTNESWSDDMEPPTGGSRSRSGGVSVLRQQKYIELALVADNRAFNKMNRDMTKMRQRIFEITNFVNMVYRPLRTFIALVGLEVWSTNDLISVTNPAGANLDAFMKWRKSNLAERIKHDNAHLISGIDFEGSTVGLAFIGTLCTDHSVGVVQDHNDRAIAVGATLAHEMGHNLGMSHDDSSACICSGDSCIMAAALSWNIPRSFSSCSSSNYERYLTTRSPSCLFDKPDYMRIEAPAVCGNGFKEKGEQCDCGTVQECTNPCCNATTCTLSAGSQCAEGECCADCQIQPRSRECRPKQDDCDLAEYCNGKSATCPEDVFAVNGLPCNKGLGYCYNGQCPQRSTQCLKLYGNTASEASPSCYNNNGRGTNYGYCRRLSDSQFIPCQPQDFFCGKLFCSGGNPNPIYSQMVSIGSCKAAFFQDYTKDYGQVEEGTVCGEGKVCSQNQCMDVEAAYRNTNCSAKCPGNAVCNHRSECQCTPGWLPPNCGAQDEAFSSLSTGAKVAVSLAVILVVLGLVFGVVGFMCKKKKQAPSLPTLSAPREPPVARSSAPRTNQKANIGQPMPLRQAPKPKPKGAPPPPPAAGNRPKPPSQNYLAARQALRPVPPPKV